MARAPVPSQAKQRPQPVLAGPCPTSPASLLGLQADPNLSPLELLELGAPAVRYLRAFTTQCWQPVSLACNCMLVAPWVGAGAAARRRARMFAVAAAAVTWQHPADSLPTISVPLAALPCRTPPPHPPPFPATSMHTLCRCLHGARCDAPAAPALLQDQSAPIAMFDNSWAVALVTIWNDLTVPSNGL